MSDLAKACGSSAHFAQASAAGGPYALRCSCSPCWLAAVGIFAVGPCVQSGTDSDGNPYTGVPAPSSLYLSIRSAQVIGSSIVVPFTFHYLDASCGTAAYSGSLSLKVGRDTGGAWIALPTISVPGGPTLHPYLNAFSPDAIALGTGDLSSFAFPNWCGPPEYGIPLVMRSTSASNLPCVYSDTLTPGRVHWRDLIPILDGIFGPHPPIYSAGCPGSTGLTTGTVYYMGGSTPQPCSPSNAGAFIICDPPVTQGLCLPSANSCTLDALDQSSRKLRAFPRYTWTTPAGPLTTDSSFNLVVTARNPFTGNLLDGTHAFGNTQEADADVVPDMDLLALLDPDETMQFSTITRLSYGVYQFNNVKFYCQPGSRQFEVYGNFVNVSLIPVSRFKIPGNPITVTAGAPAYVDLPPPNPAFTPVLYQIGQTILISGSPVLARVLDRCGFSDVWNVVPTATNTVTVQLVDDGGNALVGPTLGGTLSQSAVAGIASFGDLAAHALGRNYHLSLANPPSPGLLRTHNANWFSFPIELWIGLAFEAPPALVHGVAATIKVDLVDALGAVVSPSTIDQVALSGGGSFSGFGSVSPVAGVASFTGTFPAAGTYTLQVVTSGTTYDGPGTAGILPVTIVVTVT